MADAREDESERFASREEWARLYIAHNPDDHALKLIGAYNKTDLGERLGYFTLDEVRMLQASVGAAGLSPEKLQQMKTEAEAEREEHERKRQVRLRLTVAALAKLPDDEILTAALTRAWDRMEEDPEAYSSLPLQVRCAIAMNALDSEVLNGGFRQYFDNQYDRWLDHALAGLRAIGAKKLAEIAEQASCDRDRGDAHLAMLNDQYYATRAELDVEKRFADFVRQHVEQF